VTEPLEDLCRACGLCCDGTLFGLVPVTAEEARRTRLPLVRALGTPQPVLPVILAASKEVRSGVVYATLIVVLVFVPLFALPGIEVAIVARARTLLRELDVEGPRDPSLATELRDLLATWFSRAK